MSVQPETRYAPMVDGYVGYQVFGRGPRDILFVTNWATNVDAMWEEPSLVRYFDRLGSFARVIFFDKRGSGISDAVPLSSPTTLESWMDDARLVADAAAAGPLVVVGDTEGGPMAALFSATYPNRVSSLILINTYARMLRADDYRIGLRPAAARGLAEAYERHYGTGDDLYLSAPSIADDPRFRLWYGRYERLAVPPRAARTMYEWVQRFDVRSVLESIQTPTLVIQRRANRYYRARYGRYLAQAIPGATYVELPGADCHPFWVNASDVLDEIEVFLTGIHAPAASDRRLATVLFTDIVDSTVLAVRLGDDRWRDRLEAHRTLIRRLLTRFDGLEIDTTGDGFLAIFDGPTRAVRCALAIVDAAPDMGVDVRAGLHTGEIELQGSDIAGIAVHIAARVLAEASPRTVMTTSTVRELALGSGIDFDNRGSHELKGVPGTWQLFEATESQG